MSFKEGDKVLRIGGDNSSNGFMVKGKEYIVTNAPDGAATIRVDGSKWVWDITNFELVCKKFDFKNDHWFIRVDTPEQSQAAQEWLFAQGITWCDGTTRAVVETVPFSPILTNYFVGDNGINNSGFMHSNLDKRYNDPAREIKLTFIKPKLVVDQAVIPEVKSVKQIKIEELEETIRKANEQIQALKKEI